MESTYFVYLHLKNCTGSIILKLSVGCFLYNLCSNLYRIWRVQNALALVMVNFLHPYWRISLWIRTILRCMHSRVFSFSFSLRIIRVIRDLLAPGLARVLSEMLNRCWSIMLVVFRWSDFGINSLRRKICSRFTHRVVDIWPSEIVHYWNVPKLREWSAVIGD